MVMGMTRVNEVAYITVGVGDLKITNTSDGNGELILEWFSVRDFQQRCDASLGLKLETAQHWVFLVWNLQSQEGQTCLF